MRPGEKWGGRLARLSQFFLLLLAGIMIFSLPGLTQNPPVIEVKKRPRPARMAVPDFRPFPGMAAEDKAPSLLGHLMREAVKFCGLFELVPSDSYPPPGPAGSKPDFKAWQLIGAEYLILGDVAAAGNGRYQVEMRCYDITQGQLVLGKRYTAGPELFSRIVLRFLDDLIEALTGRKSALDARIAFVSDVSRRKEIHIMGTDGHYQQALTSNRTLNLSPAWSPDGRFLLYTSYRYRNPDLFLLEVATGREIRFFAGLGLNAAGEFRPDGRVIAFFREGDDGNVDIYTIDLNGQNLQRLTYHEANEVSPTWSADGRFLAFVSDRTGSPQVYLLNLSRGPEGPGNPAVRLTHEGNYNTNPAWSPDGRYLAYSSRVGGQFDLFLLDMAAAGNPVRRLTATNYNEENPAWSPDSWFLVYDSTKNGNYDIFMMSIYGGEPRQLTRSPANERMPAWSPRNQ